MATLSGVVTVAVAGTAVQFPDITINGPVAISAPKANTGVAFIGHVDKDVAAANGYELAQGERVEMYFVDNLNVLWADVATGGDKVTWMKLAVRHAV